MPGSVSALPLILFALSFAHDPAAAGEGWKVDEAHGPVQVYERELTEGSWISVDVSPDGASIVFDLLGHLYELPYDGGEAEPLTEGRSWNMFPRYDPGGGRVAFTSDRGGSNDLWIMDRGGNHLENVSEEKLPVFQGTWSADGRALYGTALDLRVRFPVARYGLHGSKQVLIPANGRSPIDHLQEDAARRLIYYEHNDGRLPASGPRLKSWDMETGEIRVLVERPGGAASPRLSPVGDHLAYVHRDDQDTVLVVRDLTTGVERTVLRGLDRGRFESGSFYGCYPNLAWHPWGREIVLSFDGGIHAVDADTGDVREIPFRARVRRELDETLRFRGTIPEQTARTRSHRWAQRTPHGVLFEALGDLWLRTPDGRTHALTDSPEYETDPVFVSDARDGRVVCATWDDDDLGRLVSRPLVQVGDRWRLDAEGGHAMDDTPSQYGAIDAPSMPIEIRWGFFQVAAWMRGQDDLRRGMHLEDQTGFELMFTPDARQPGEVRHVTDVSWSENRYAHRPPTVRVVPPQPRPDGSIDPDAGHLLFTEYEGDQLVLKRVRFDGQDEKTLVVFPHATRAVVSPDQRWIAFREYHRSFVTPLAWVGKPATVSAADGNGIAQRVDAEDGDFMVWSPDGRTLGWTRGSAFLEKSLDDILEDRPLVRRTELSMEYALSAPDSVVALRDVRVLTMNAADDVLEGATVLVEGNRITAVGADVAIPDGARVFDLEGRTLMPGMFDAHGHYGGRISALNVIEQRLYGLHANLAHGVTTMFDVYGTTHKDFWVSDMLRKGDMIGPRLFSVGDPIFVTKYRKKMHRPIASAADALEHARFNKDHGATALKDYSNHTRAARQQLAAACRATGLNLVTESFGDAQMNLTQLVDGFTGIEHTMGLTPLHDDVVSFFGATRVGMTPTLIVLYGGPSGERWFHQSERLWEDPKLLNFYRQDELLGYRRTPHVFEDDFSHPAVGHELLKLHRAGVLLQMGAHGQMMGLGAHWEMELFVHGGFTPLQAIRIATVNGFTHHGLDHELGSLEPGKLADLVVLARNPVDDIRNTRSIELVMKNGVLYDGADAARVYPGPSPAKRMYFHER